MKKRNLLLIFALLTCLCLSACAEKKDPPTVEDTIEQTQSAMETLTKNADERDKQREELIEKNRVDLEDEIVFSTSVADVKIKAYSIIPWTSLGEEQEQIYFIFDYTNKYTEDTYFNMQIEMTGYQDGIGLSEAVYIDDYSGKAIRPGTTIENKKALILRNNDSDVALKLTAYSTSDGLRTAAFEESAEYTIKIK